MPCVPRTVLESCRKTTHAETRLVKITCTTYPHALLSISYSLCRSGSCTSTLSLPMENRDFALAFWRPDRSDSSSFDHLTLPCPKLTPVQAGKQTNRQTDSRTTTPTHHPKNNLHQSSDPVTLGYRMFTKLKHKQNKPW